MAGVVPLGRSVGKAWVGNGEMCVRESNCQQEDSIWMTEIESTQCVYIYTRHSVPTSSNMVTPRDRGIHEVFKFQVPQAYTCLPALHHTREIKSS